ncbi:MAG: transglutaminase-like domain-containing protein, partial [Anaerolineae bacterium]
IFAGVQPRRSGQPGGPGGVGGSGVLPRSYLLGNPPELSETVVMTAVVTLPNNVPPDLLAGHHWRALSYDVYTGRGWALSEERRESVSSGETIRLLPAQSTVEVDQTVHWTQDDRVIRYTLGLPLRFDQDVTVIWRGLTDLARVQGTGGAYRATSRLSAATGQALRETAVGDIPPAIIARYTKLPDSLPQRVRDLAQEVAGDLPTAYDQARALERFLRQYPYSLDVELPPDGVDPVDFFLFDLQRGYCDYYASTMAVMARSLGLPARVAVGFLPQPADENGVQTIYQINGHSWTEIYFSDYGWIEFEPTAAFPSPRDRLDSASALVNPDAASEPASPPIPPSAPAEPTWRRLWRGWRWILLVVALAAGYWLWQRQQKQWAGRDSVLWAYGRFQHQADKLGQPPHPSQTPDEFTAVFLDYLNRYANNSYLTTLIAQMRDPIERLNRLFVRRQYGREAQTGMNAAQESWQQIRQPLWLLRLIRFISRNRE